MKQNQWFPVRCCCTPKKIFGFISLPAQDYRYLPVHTTLTDTFGQSHPIKLMSIYVDNYHMASCRDYFNNPQPAQKLETIAPEIAIYSDDRPIEFWRTIPGFVEAPQTED